MARSRLTRVLGWTATAGVLLCALAGGWGWWRLHSSLPQLDGESRLGGLQAAVSVERDAQGIPTLKASQETDAFRALGWLHAQDRFFQMDLQRRRASGELAELFGVKALELDRWASALEFRRFAEDALKGLPAGQQALLNAYAEGVNAGLASLSNPPWEYALLGQSPRAWTPLDSLLCGYCMIIDLQDDGTYERNLSTLREQLGQTAVDFFAPLIGPDDSAVDGSRADLPDPPGPSRINLHQSIEGEPLGLLPTLEGGLSLFSPGPIPGTGSNAFAVHGEKTASGRGLVGNDMHLRLAVPNTWYRAVLEWPLGSGGERRRLAGLTLPGLPLLIAGSNGHVAWGFTNSYADTSDLALVELDPLDSDQYRQGQNWLRFEQRSRLIQVKGAAPVRHTYRWCHWGPVVGEAPNKRLYALKWTALSADAVDLHFAGIHGVSTAVEAARLGAEAGLPALNLLAADREGAIAWTVAGRLPHRKGYSGRFPIPHTFGDRGWEGTLPASAHPLVVSPKEGFFSSANERLFGGETLAVLGDGGYGSADRGRQLRDSLAELSSVSRGSLQPADLLALQLDDRALALRPWRELLLKALDEESLASRPARRKLREVVEQWIPNASPASSGYRLVREFKDQLCALVLDPILEPCRAADDTFSARHFHTDAAVRRLIEDKPRHLLRSKYDSWEALVLSAADEVLDKAGDPAKATWGERNTARIRHPFSRSLPPFLSRFLDMPAEPLAGDHDMPRVVRPSFGASERFVVSPGLEEQGLCHMPCGQSANPVSPFYRAGHEDWVQGRPSPFLPGPVRHKLVLSPR